MTYLRKYLSNDRTTTAVTVVPSSAAFSTAAFHIGSGMRSERGMVATSGPNGEATVVGQVRQRRVVGRVDEPVNLARLVRVPLRHAEVLGSQRADVGDEREGRADVLRVGLDTWPFCITHGAPYLVGETS